jgi:HK97 family phage major capsid protein
MQIRDIGGAPLVERTCRMAATTAADGARRVELSFSSEQPYERWWGIEILDHEASSMRLGRLSGGDHPLLVNHDPDRQVGVIEQATLGGDRKGRSVVRFGQGAYASEIWQDVQDNIRSLVSVGYIIHRAKLIESDGERELTGAELMQRMQSPGRREGGDAKTPVYRIIDWEPYEVSIVSIPADTSVGVGRAAIIEPQDEANAAPARHKDIIVSTDNTVPVVDIGAAEQAARKSEAARITEIISVGEQFAKHGGQDLASRAVREGKDLKWLTDELLKRMASQPSECGPNIGMTSAEVKRYSVSRAITGLLRTARNDQNAWKGAEFERDCHLATEGVSGEAKNGGILVPFDVQHARGMPWQEQRDLTTTPGSAGGYLVSTTNQPQSFIELLRNSARVIAAGVTVLPGLKDNITIPKQSGASTLYWLSTEATPITESNLSFGQIAMSPKNAGAYVEISQQLLMQSGPAADMLVWQDFAKVAALGVDTAVLNGSGSSGEPLGLLNTGGLGSVSGSTLGYAGCVEFQTDVATANALSNSFKYLTTPVVAGLLMGRSRFTNTDTPVWTGSVLDGVVAGFPALASTNVPSATVVAGDFSQILLGEWGTLELALNPYANFAAGIVGLRLWLSIDVAVRQATAFSVATSVT